jgi:hypothetical protein
MPSLSDARNLKAVKDIYLDLKCTSLTALIDALKSNHDFIATNGVPSSGVKFF